VRIVDVPGSGDFVDDADTCLAPNTGPDWTNYVAPHPIYDQWPTWGSGGFDLEAVGVLHAQELPADFDLDGVVDARDLAALLAAWQNRFGDERWNARCDLGPQKDLFIDGADFAAFAAQWGRVERWRAEFNEK